VTALVSLKSTEELTAEETEELAAMKAAVYPDPQPGSREWAPRQWGVFVRSDDVLVSYTGLLVREGHVDEVPARIGGIGGVATHPSHRGRGYAPLGMARALDFLLDIEADFALLVCREPLIPYYERLGWRQFTGTLLVTQHGQPETFTFNEVMVGDLTAGAPTGGTIDLDGPPW